MKRYKIKLASAINRIKVFGKPKIFCIGFNKTGTTSLKHLFIDLGFVLGEQRAAELLLQELTKGEYRGLVSYTKNAQFFQDYPFSAPGLYKVLDKLYPDARFILTERNSPEEWYNSLVRFHSQKFNDGKFPTIKSLKESQYVYKGWIWEFLCKVYNFEENGKLYDKEKLINLYVNHNSSVKHHFKDKENKLLTLNLQEETGIRDFNNFFRFEHPIEKFPWENKSK
ncbi:sulfotransferase [uncultured Cyclobacterium sp.]|uniref:sulfotransferase n=1 Tax=uncultured Cyclobacterium sp. TaxID=453820 RepID=UPI0030ED5D54|tara:strand:+ start:1372 stop:2046 length:675 start_codon:yes stop_codon:yes gene_type:complete